MTIRAAPIRPARSAMRRKSRIPAQKPQRGAENALYHERAAAYLALHPYDQSVIALRGYDEATVILNAGWMPVPRDEFDGPGGFTVPLATAIHHRNKRHGKRLLDERWWLAVSAQQHALIEHIKDWSRAQGFLLPVQADADGRWGDGNQGQTTPELLAARAKR